MVFDVFQSIFPFCLYFSSDTQGEGEKHGGKCNKQADAGDVVSVSGIEGEGVVRTG